MNNSEKIDFLLQVMGEVNAELEGGSGRVQILPLTTVFKALEIGVTALLDLNDLEVKIQNPINPPDIPVEVPKNDEQ